MAALAFLLNIYAPLNIPQPMKAKPQWYLKLLPSVIGEDEITAEKHLPVFCNFVENLNVEHLDVVMRHFVQSLNGEAINWFKGFPNDSINTWEELENQFTQRWGEKRDHGYSLTGFNAIK